jgi:hypothetical protein
MRVRRAGLVAAAWAPALLTGLGGGLVAADVEYAPAQSTRLIAVFPPWWTVERALTAVGDIAAATGVRAGGFALAVAGEPPDLAQRLRDRGALWVLDGDANPACFFER